MKKLLLTLALVSAIAFTGCSNNSDKPAENEKKTEQPAEKTEEKTVEKAAIKEMKGADLEAIEQDKKKKETILVVDVRSKEEYDQGHVKWAINMPIDTFEQEVSKLDAYKDKAVVTICNIGDIKDGKVDEGSSDKISHKAHGQAIDRVADSTARNHSHAHNL